MENKKASHVGIVLSLVIFVSFLIFLYIILNSPLKVQKNSQLAIDYLEAKLIERASSNLTTVGLSISDSYAPEEDKCIRISHEEDLGTLNSIVKDKDKLVVDSDHGSDYLVIDWEEGDKKFFKFYYSEESFDSFPFGEEDCSTPVKGEDYFIENVNSNEKIFETKIKDLIVYYEEDYEDLKDSLAIPFETEFGFNFTYNNGTSIGAVIGTKAPEIYVQDFTIEYVDTKANINPGVLSIIVW